MLSMNYWKTKRRYQMNNEEIFIAFDDLSASLEQWSRISGVPMQIIYDRIHHGWSFEEALCFDENERRPRNKQERVSIVKYMEKRIRVMHKAEMLETRRRKEEEARKREDKRKEQLKKLIDERKKRFNRNIVLITPSATYKVVYFEQVSSHSGRWTTRIMSGAELCTLINNYRHTIESWEKYRVR